LRRFGNGEPKANLGRPVKVEVEFVLMPGLTQRTGVLEDKLGQKAVVVFAKQSLKVGLQKVSTAEMIEHRLGELDVIGLDFKTSTAILCEVTTHIRGLLYVNNQESVARVRRKHQRQREYAAKYLSNFENTVYQFWSPVVPKGYLTEHLAEIDGLELIINSEYKKRVQELRVCAATQTQDAGNPVFRVLQILEHLRD